MKTVRILVLALCTLAFSAGSVSAAEAPKKKLTCCQEAKAKGKECSNKCCIAAHKRKESCKRCNPNGEDMPKPAPKQDEKPKA